MTTMKRQIRFSKLRFLIGFVIALFMVVFLDSVVFASLPYTYSFDEDRNIIVDFDYDLEGVTSEAISIQTVPPKEFVSLELKATSYENDDNLKVEIKGLDPGVTDYHLVIEPGALDFGGNYNQVTTFRLAFRYFDIAPGFKTTFVDGDSVSINTIFKRNAPRDIYLNVPYLYFDQIRTVHRYNSWIDDAESNLTNIDIWTKEQVDRVDVRIDQNIRRLSRHTNELFTTGFAGLESTTSSSISKPYSTDSDPDDINISAYDEYGRKLGERFFRLSVRDKEDDYIIDDYIDRGNEDDVFGKQYTLLELMEDETLLENILSKISVTDLDKIGVHYMSIDEIIDVGNDANLLARALALDDLKNKVIRIDGTVDLDADLIVDKDVRIVGAPGSRISFSGQGQGEKVVLEGGTNINVTLSGITIDGDLDIDVGDSGNAHLNGVTVNGDTNVISGGDNSIILNNFKTDKLIINSNSEIRIVFEEKFGGNIVVKGDGEVKFENNTNDTIKVDFEFDHDTEEDTGAIEITHKEEIHVERVLSIASITGGSITYGSITLTHSSIDIDGNTIQQFTDGHWVDSGFTQSAIEVKNGERYSFRVKKYNSGITKYSNPVILNPVDDLEIISDPINTDGAIEFTVPKELDIEDKKEYVIFQQIKVTNGAIDSVTGGAVNFENLKEDGKISVEFEPRAQGADYEFRMIITDVNNKRAGVSNKVEGKVD